VSTFPALDQNSFQPQGPPHLDPAVESMLASYFPPATTTTNPGELGPAAASQVPDDFLSRVFSFSWDNTQGGTATPNQSTTPNQTQVATPGVRPNGLQGQPRPGPNGQQPGYGAFDWSSHGWMA
jgi:hypothetical protein